MFVYLALLKFCFFFIDIGKRNCFFNPNFQRIAKQLKTITNSSSAKIVRKKKVSSNRMCGEKIRMGGLAWFFFNADFISIHVYVCNIFCIMSLKCYFKGHKKFVLAQGGKNPLGYSERLWKTNMCNIRNFVHSWRGLLLVYINLVWVLHKGILEY